MTGATAANLDQMRLPFENVQSVFLDETHIRFRIALALIAVCRWLDQQTVSHSLPMPSVIDR